MVSKHGEISRREFLTRCTQAAAGIAAGAALVSCTTTPQTVPQTGIPMSERGLGIRFGLVTYLWGKDWDLPTLIRNCQRTRVLGVELRTEHAHGVEANLNTKQRFEVKLRFDSSPVALVGLGTNFSFHHIDPAVLQENIDGAKRYIILSHDVGSSGVKVKPNALPEEVSVDETIEQIGKSLNELGQFSADYGQEIRVEVHGKKTQQLPIMNRIFDIVDQPNVGICWNSNQEDLTGEGLEFNFNLVKDRFGHTVHIRELNIGEYPYQQLINHFVQMDYEGYILLEARGTPKDRIKALAEQRMLFEQMMANAQGAA